MVAPPTRWCINSDLQFRLGPFVMLMAYRQTDAAAHVARGISTYSVL